MQYRRLPGTDLRISRLCLGTWVFGTRVAEAESIGMIHTALDAGVTFFDTADSYGEGASERVLGKALAGRRNRVVLATKVGCLPGDKTDLTAAHIEKAVTGSLERLQTDHLDICYFHAPDHDTPLEQSLRAMHGLIEAGKVRNFGLSNYAADQLRHACRLCHEPGLHRPVVAQNVYNLLARRLEPELLPCCKELGVGITVFNPLAGGLLTGKHSAAAAPTAGTRFAWNKKYRGRYWNQSNFEAVRALAEIAGNTGKTLIELALQWCMAQRQIDAVIIGASRIGQLEENLRAWHGTLDGDTLAACDAIWEHVKNVACPYSR